jgi:hypothetical protein
MEGNSATDASRAAAGHGSQRVIDLGRPRKTWKEE